MLPLVHKVLCFCWLVTGSFAALAPFIDKCIWNDKDCLRKSTQKAIPNFADGIPNVSMPPMDPMGLDTVIFDTGILKVEFKNMILTGTKNCNFISVERRRNKNKETIQLKVECPIELKGNYVASGNLLGIPMEGDGPFQVTSDKLVLDIKTNVGIVDGKDGQKHWKLTRSTESYEFFEKTLLKFENLFNGDKEKAKPLEMVISQAWKEILQTFGKPIVDEVLKQIHTRLGLFFATVPVSELEIEN